MKEKRVSKRYTKSFKEAAVAVITEQGYNARKAVDLLGIRTNMLY
jgi:transposase